MPSPDLLESAGQRAAYRPVPMPPALDDLVHEVDRRRKKRRLIGGGVGALSLALALPFVTSFVTNDEPDVVTFATEDAGASSVSDSPVAVQPAATSTTTSTSTTTPAESSSDFGPFAGMDEENFDLSLNFGDTSIAIEVITGGDAADRAAAAETAATTTRTIDDETIWLEEVGDQVTAAAFFETDTFVSVTGPADDIDRVLDLVTEHANGPVQFFDPSEFANRFDLPEGLFDDDLDFDGDLNFDFDGDGLPEDLDSFFENGVFPGLDDAAMEDFRREMDEFSECMRIELDRNGDSATIEIPDCDFPGLDGLITPGLSEFFDGQDFDSKDFDSLFSGDVLDEITKELDDLLDDAFDDALADAQDALKDAQDALDDAS